MEQLNQSIFTENYFKEIIQDHLNSAISVKNLQISPCNGTGEGFLSSLLRITIEYQDISSKIIQKISVITKSECTNEFALEKVGKNGFDVQNKEIEFFQKIAPQMLKIFGIDSSKIFPDIIKIDEINNILIFEDLRELNYKMADRINGMDENHAAMCLKKFAEFHAATLKIQEMNPNAFADYQTGMFSRNADGFNSAMVNLYQSAIDEISTWKGFGKYVQKMENIKGNILDNMNKCFDVNSDELNVLNHGDLWTTNLMFQYDKGSDVPKNLVLIDFQFCHYGSPAIDLLRYLFTSINDDLYNPDDIKRLLKIYFTELLNYFDLFGCKNANISTFEKFLNEFYSKLFFGFIFNICVLPVMTSDDPDNDFIAHHTNDDRSKAFRRRVMKTERYQRIVKRMLPFYESMGISMDPTLSSIFTKDYFQKILQDYYKTPNLLDIISLKISPCSGTSEGFHSSLNRVSIEFQDSVTKITQKISLITKSECTNEFSMNKVGKNGFDVQNKEINFFIQIAPKMMEIFGTESPKIFPGVMKIDEDNKILIFEDLNELNYQTADHFVGLDEDHVKLCFQKFAKFHAASLKIYNENPDAFEDFQKGMFGSQVDQFDFPIVTLYQAAVDEISTWSGYEEYGQKLDKIKEKSLKELKQCFDVNENELNVLNQGDLWTNNLMFQYEEGSDVLKNLVLIDFQFCHYGSFALDLTRFIFTSINDELYNPNEIQRLLKFYYQELVKNLEILNLNHPKLSSFDKILNEFHGKLYFGEYEI
ncbi:uncharacterized protein [Chironomus tepperi]|uniref:uncharacterized protein n=1 Tax=Chironomus tepperi TaxID=113505 RepID=UPI00391F7A0F